MCNYSNILESLKANRNEPIEVDEFGIELSAYEEPFILENTDDEIEILKDKIIQGVIIPHELKDFIILDRGTLGSLHFIFRADGKLNDPFLTAYSKGGFLITFSFRGYAYISYNGKVAYSVTLYKVPKLMQVKTPQDVDKVIKKLNDYLHKNKKDLIAMTQGTYDEKKKEDIKAPSTSVKKHSGISW